MSLNRQSESSRFYCFGVLALCGWPMVRMARIIVVEGRGGFLLGSSEYLSRSFFWSCIVSHDWHPFSEAIFSRPVRGGLSFCRTIKLLNRVSDNNKHCITRLEMMMMRSIHPVTNECRGRLNLNPRRTIPSSRHEQEISIPCVIKIDDPKSCPGLCSLLSCEMVMSPH